MLFSKEMYSPLYQQYWIINKLCLGLAGWRFFLFILLTCNSYPQVVTQGVDYFYHPRAYRQSILNTIARANDPSLVVEPSVDYMVDSGYENAQVRVSPANSGGKPASLHGYGKDSMDYNIGVDEIFPSVRALDTIVNNNDNFHRRQSKQSNEVNQKDGIADLVKHNPSPASQLKASGLNIDSSHPITMFARSSSSARIQTNDEESVSNLLFVGSVIGVTCVGIFVVVATGFFVHRINVQRKAAADVEYPAYGVVGPGATIKEKEALSSVKSTSGTSKGTSSGTGSGPGVCGSGSLSPSGDRRLARSAQMYHYHHQKQQMISSDKVADAGQHPSTSDVDSEEEENEEGDYTVYECPGLASTGEIEVKNPLFHDDITPIASPSVSNVTKQDGSTNP